jgi:hypothetical protein
MIGKKGAKLKAWKACSRYIRAYYADKYGRCRCVTCGEYLQYNKTECNAGHFVGGRGNAVLLDEELIRPQCQKCNLFMDGQQGKFALYLMREEGKTQEQIEEMLNRRHKIVKYSLQDYLRLADEYNNKADAIIAIKGI